jgi:hypothetical protein
MRGERSSGSLTEPRHDVDNASREARLEEQLPTETGIVSPVIFVAHPDM